MNSPTRADLDSTHDFPAPDGRTTPLSAEAPGARIGPYLLLESIGEGGMGTVHLAEQWTVGSDGTWKLVLSTLQDAVSYVDGKQIVNQRQQAPPTSALIAELQAHALVIPTLAFDADSAQLAELLETHRIGRAQSDGDHGDVLGRRRLQLLCRPLLRGFCGVPLCRSWVLDWESQL